MNRLPLFQELSVLMTVGINDMSALSEIIVFLHTFYYINCNTVFYLCLIQERFCKGLFSVYIQVKLSGMSLCQTTKLKH